MGPVRLSILSHAERTLLPDATSSCLMSIIGHYERHNLLYCLMHASATPVNECLRDVLPHPLVANDHTSAGTALGSTDSSPLSLLSDL